MKTRPSNGERLDGLVFNLTAFSLVLLATVTALNLLPSWALVGIYLALLTAGVIAALIR